jgi:four helix bundle protein
MTEIRTHRDLVVWQKAMDLAVEVYALAKHLPSAENFRMIAQITRAVVSVPANIAEGRARSTRKDYANFLAIAQGSLAETETYLLLCIRLGFLTAGETDQALSLAGEIGRMLTALRKRLTPK